MDDNRIKLIGEELYEKVWNTPAIKLAKEFSISDVDGIWLRHQHKHIPFGSIAPSAA